MTSLCTTELFKQRSTRNDYHFIALGALHLHITFSYYPRLARTL